MKKTKKILLATLAVLSIGIGALGMTSCEGFGAFFGNIAGCNSSEEDTEGQNESIREVYGMYVVYAEAQGIEPKSYEEWLESINGEKGDKGEQGEQGLPGQDGKDGEDGTDGKDGVDGEDGEKGDKGDKGEAGEDGVSVVNVEITYATNKSGESIMTFTFYLSDGSTIVEEVVLGKAEKPEEEQRASEGLEYELNEDGESYSVIGIGSCTDTDIVIPSTYEGKPVTTIHYNAFMYSDMVTITIPDSIISIEPTFYFCPNLNSFTVDKNNPNYCSVDGILFNKNKTTIVRYPEGKEGDTYSIPDGVVSIEYGAFATCSNLTSVKIPEGVTDINSEAFAFSGVNSIEIPDSVIDWSDWVFYNCDNLTRVTIGNGFTNIAEGEFQDCGNLTTVLIGKNVTDIGHSAFRYCDKLAEIYYYGTAEDWAKIDIDDYNENLTSATCYYYSEIEPTEEGNYWHYDENGEIAVW